MKTTHLVALAVIAVAIVIIMSTAGNASQYVTFDTAQELAKDGEAEQIHVVGTLKKSDNGDVLGIERSPDFLSFQFMMVDQDGREEKVYHPNPMPTDFLRSEQVVVVGRYKEEQFIADKILLKCPSKYQEEEVQI